MGRYLVQAIVIHNEHIWLEKNEDGAGKWVYKLLTLEQEDEKEALDCIKNRIKTDLGVEIKQIFKFKNELQQDTNTYLIDVKQRNGITSAENVKSGTGDGSLSFYEWKSVEEIDEKNKIFRDLLLLYRECIDRCYDLGCLDILESMATASRNYKYTNYTASKKRRTTVVERIDKSIPYNHKIAAIFISLLLGVIFDRFFTERAPGVSVIIYLSLLMAYFLWINREKITPESRKGYLMLIPTYMIALCFGLYSNPVLTTLNILLLPLLIVTSTMMIKNIKLPWDNFGFLSKILERVTTLTFENWFKSFKFIKGALKEGNVRQLSSTKKNIIKGLLISLPLLLVIVLLLTSADMVFSYYLTNFTEVFKFVDLGSTIFHAICIILVALYIFAYAWSFKYPYRNCGESSFKVRKWEPVTVLTVIFVINIIYLIFTFIQFSYLYGGGTGILPPGFTYAEYARKGFFELVTVTIINFIILLSSMKFMGDMNRITGIASKILLTLLIFFTSNMLYSAHYKMSLYEESYGYTYLRAFVHYFMLLLLILFLIALAGIWYKRLASIKLMLITAITMYVILNFINVDSFIARQNIKLYKETKKIDVIYLANLSYDAVPYLKELEKDDDPRIAGTAVKYLDTKKGKLDKQNTFLEFNYSKYKARKLLQKNY